MIELNEEQKLAVEKAQNEFSELKNNSNNLTDDQLNLLFGQARSMNGCLLYTSPSPRDS